ncbi:DNA helicase II [Arthrobacter sp. MYb227]|uniref:UvrD-helicase domain-containing protein n=1 Tax=Arthrobacter sp. MYb227 TaxID=1848601 RepID=UPI000CFE2875|nr:UvrD-helicase domain-containing protein [Arthrobacter sp. MYb227]PQZ92881.1 DNA helicase II [Arthrobacter sp. MYb227]
MGSNIVATNADEVALATQSKISNCLSVPKSFLVEAGAGAGKTTSLIDALRFLQNSSSHALQSGRRVACITYTNVAKDEILDRIDADPRFFVATIHEFFWSVMKPFQSQLRSLLEPEKWAKVLERSDIDSITDQHIEYSRGYRRVTESEVSLHHDDVPALAALLMRKQKFVTRLKSQYPIVLIDEYQDTDDTLAHAILEHCVKSNKGPAFGFFGDDWQQIHSGSVGKISQTELEVIQKGTNFRSSAPIVRALNAMRPTLTQAMPSLKEKGQAFVFHTDKWLDGRVPGTHTQNDLDHELVDSALALVRETLETNGWDLAPAKTKTLILTHKSIAARQGYPTIEGIFGNKDDFVKLENHLVKFLIAMVEPARAHFKSGRTGMFFDALGITQPMLRCNSDKSHLHAALTNIVNETECGTVRSVLAHFRKPPFSIPADVEQQLNELGDLTSDKERTRRQLELEKLLDVDYREIVALNDFIGHHSPYETEHGVKGAQFENVIVLLGGGWNHYNFPRFLSYAADPSKVPQKDWKGFVRARNLFYVCASRPTTNVALLFTQQLEAAAHDVLESWFGSSNVHALPVPTSS